MLTRSDIRRIELEAIAAAKRGETFAQAAAGYTPHTPAWRLIHRAHAGVLTAHRISSLMATDPAARLLSSGGSVEETPAAVPHNDSRSL